MTSCVRSRRRSDQERTAPIADHGRRLACPEVPADVDEGGRGPPLSVGDEPWVSPELKSGGSARDR